MIRTWNGYFVTHVIIECTLVVIIIIIVAVYNNCLYQIGKHQVEQIEVYEGSIYVHKRR